MNPTDKIDAIAMIDAHKNRLLDPVEMLNWTWLRVILDNIGDDCWDYACERAAKVMSR